MGVLSYSLSDGLGSGLESGILGITSNDGHLVGMSYEMSYKQVSALIYGLYLGLHYGLSVCWIFLLTGMMVMWAPSGGLTVLRHYVIRLLLARYSIFPFRASTFLDDQGFGVYPIVLNN